MSWIGGLYSTENNTEMHHKRHWGRILNVTWDSSPSPINPLLLHHTHKAHTSRSNKHLHLKHTENSELFSLVQKYTITMLTNMQTQYRAEAYMNQRLNIFWLPSLSRWPFPTHHCWFLGEDQGKPQIKKRKQHQTNLAVAILTYSIFRDPAPELSTNFISDDRHSGFYIITFKIKIYPRNCSEQYTYQLFAIFFHLLAIFLDLMRRCFSKPRIGSVHFEFKVCTQMEHADWSRTTPVVPCTTTNMAAPIANHFIAHPSPPPSTKHGT